MEIIQLDHALAKLFMSELAGYVVATDQRQYYHLWTAIDSVISEPKIVDMLKKYYDKEYEDIIKEFLNSFANINEIKLHLDTLDESTVKKNDVTNAQWKRTMQISRKMGLTFRLLHHILILILTRTQCRTWTIQDTDKKRFERVYKKGTDFSLKDDKNIRRPEVQSDVLPR